MNSPKMYQQGVQYFLDEECTKEVEESIIKFLFKKEDGNMDQSACVRILPVEEDSIAGIPQKKKIFSKIFGRKA